MTELKAPTFRAPQAILSQMQDFVEKASPALLKEMEEATLKVNGKARRESSTPLLQFLDYAVWLVFNPKETHGGSARFGTRIDADVAEIMTANREAYAKNPDEWWNLTAIGTTLLRARGHNPTTIATWWKLNQDAIAAHHAEVGIDKFRNEKITTAEEAVLSHNRRAGKARSLRK